jgi:hypothetical protein
MNWPFRSLTVLLLAGALALFAACGPTLKQVTLQQKDSEHVFLQSLVEKDGQVVPQHYDHPATLTAAQVDAMLAAIRFEEHMFFAWRDRGPLFIDEERAKLAPWLADALQKATPDQWVHFAVTGMKRDLLFKTKHLTDGVCFVKDGKLHLVIANINFEMIDPEKDFYRLDPRDRVVLNALRLKPDPAKGLELPPIIKGDKWLDTERRNWLLIDTQKFAAVTPAPAPTPTAAPAPTVPPPEPPAVTPPATAPAAPQVAPPTATPAPDASLRPDVIERLKKLKELYDLGLITKEEYDKKRQEILQGL